MPNLILPNFLAANNQQNLIISLFLNTSKKSHENSHGHNRNSSFFIRRIGTQKSQVLRNILNWSHLNTTYEITGCK